MVMVTPDALPRAFSIAAEVGVGDIHQFVKVYPHSSAYECGDVGVDGGVVEGISIYNNHVSWSQSRICN